MKSYTFNLFVTLIKLKVITSYNFIDFLAWRRDMKRYNKRYESKESVETR